MNKEALLKVARIFAERYHTQKYNGKPYVYHLDKVYHVLLRFGVSDYNLLTAAYLHDVVEDTEVSVGEVESIFGSTISKIVDLISEPKEGNRKQRHDYTYPRIASNPAAIKLKLADRIANMEEGGKVDMYVSEYKDFKDALYKENCDSSTQEMWNVLDNMVSISTQRLTKQD